MKKKIMLVDARLDFGGLLQRLVPDYVVRQAMSATAALETAYFWQPDLFIIDLEVPDMRGAELAELLRNDRTLGKIPILFVSSAVGISEFAKESSVFDRNVAFGVPIT